MNRALYVTAGLLALVLILHGIRKEGATQARAEMEEQRADSIGRYADEMDRKLRADSVAFAEERATWNTERAELVGRANRASAARPVVIQRIIEVAGDSVEVLRAVSELESLHAQEVVSLRGALAISDSIIESQRQELADYSYVNGQLRAAWEASRREARAWEAAAHPKLFGIVPMGPNAAFVGGAVATAGVVVCMVLC